MVGIEMFVDEGLGHSSYLIELGDATAAILDPPRFPTEHLAAATKLGTTPRWTIDTHSHADYVTGSPALATDPGATFVAPAASKLEATDRGDEEVCCSSFSLSHSPDGSRSRRNDRDAPRTDGWYTAR